MISSSLTCYFLLHERVLSLYHVMVSHLCVVKIKALLMMLENFLNYGGKAKINFLNALKDIQHKWTGGGSFSCGIATLFFQQ